MEGLPKDHVGWVVGRQQPRWLGAARQEPRFWEAGRAA